MLIGTALFAGLFNNLAILIVLVSLYAWLHGRAGNAGSVRRVALLGGLFGLVAVACLHAGTLLPDGVIIDQRNAVIVLGGAFGGPAGGGGGAVRAAALSVAHTTPSQ